VKHRRGGELITYHVGFEPNLRQRRCEYYVAVANDLRSINSVGGLTQILVFFMSAKFPRGSELKLRRDIRPRGHIGPFFHLGNNVVI
jgi:hypothetical protein